MSKGGYAGGKARAITQRKEALDRYYLNPNYCKQCGKLISIPEGAKIPQIRHKKYCNSSCAAIYNGKAFPKRHASPYKTCENCGITITLKTMKGGGYSPRKYCDNCSKRMRVLNSNYHLMSESNKGDTFSRALNWQSGRSGIRRNASTNYKASGKPMVCLICGYSTHIHIAHIKSVSQFSPETLLTVINHPNNLIALCPNHHWEYDHNILRLEDFILVAGTGLEPVT